MQEIYFKCTLISDVVLNSKMATEGNMTTLNYIPGSNFLGIVAKELYKDLSPEKSLRLFHSKEVLFGDAVISKDNEEYYPVPFSYMQIKGNEQLGIDNVYLYHLINKENAPKTDGSFNAQLKQKREGYISAMGNMIKNPQKTFSLKSAHDPITRRSKEGAMFGFESLKSGQEFLFSIKSQNIELLDTAKNAIVGLKRLGKSKSAEFGQVYIEELKIPPKKTTTFDSQEFCLAYAKSDICFFDEYFLQPTFQPTAKQFGLEGEIDWTKSQIRTYSYSPWNGQRNTTESQRYCILAGSVFFINKGNRAGEITVGEYQAEGFGRVIINPIFLEGNPQNALLKFSLNECTKQSHIKYDNPTPHTILGKFLANKKEQKDRELKLSKAVSDTVKNASSSLLEIPASQWGNIRNYAIKATTIFSLHEDLFRESNDDTKKGYLVKGVAYDRHWNKKNNKALKEFKEVCKNNEEFGPDFIAKYAAEIVKKIQQKGNNHGE